MSRSFEEFFEEWMEERTYLLSRMWEEEQRFQEELLQERKAQKQPQKTDKQDEYNPNLPF